MNRTTLELPNLLVYSRDMERIVRLMTEASHIAYGHEARNKHIITKKWCHQIKFSLTSKRNYTGNLSILQCNIL